MPFIVATYVYARSQGQRTHSARTKIEASCVKEGNYLAWYNGEPIEHANNITQSLCEEKCDRNPDCDAWTLNTRNGWCALKRWDQVKEEENEGFVSGYKHC